MLYIDLMPSEKVILVVGPPTRHKFQGLYTTFPVVACPSRYTFPFTVSGSGSDDET